MAQITRGEDRSFTITLRDVDCNGVVGDPHDLTGKTVTVTYRDQAGVAQTLPCNILAATLGRFEAVFTEAQSNNLRVGDFKFDIVVVEGSDTKIYPIEGKILVKARNT
jgi:hypothetical protein